MHVYFNAINLNDEPYYSLLRPAQHVNHQYEELWSHLELAS